MSRRIITVGLVTGAVLVGGGGVAYAQIQGSSGSYRTAVVTTGNVDKTMNLSGKVTSSSRRDLSFGTSGKVTNVSVSAGEKVDGGDVLAKLDATGLKNAVTKATAALASARAQLASDESAQSSAVASAARSSSNSTSSSSSKGSGSSTGSGTPTPDPAVQAALAEVKKQQLAVTTAQTDATAAITAAKAALAAQKTACAGDDTSNDPDDPTPESGLSAACTTALDAVQTAQDTVAAKQDALQTALETLSKTLDAAFAAVQKASSSPTSPTGSGGSGGTGSSSSSGGTGSTPSSTGSTSKTSGGSSASSLAQDQAAIDTAKAQLTEAKLAVDSATLTAPYAGRVLSVSIAKGDDVGSSDTVMVLVGDGGTTATTTVTADQVASIKTGETAEVTPAGADQPVSGTVTSIGLLPDSSSGTVTYPVTIDLADGVTAPEGTTASIAVVTGTAKNVLTIPSSALTKLGSRAIVRVLKDGKEQTTVVTVGVVGSTRTSIATGLKKGQTVVIADLNADLPSGGASTNRFGGGANFVRPGGGFSGGGPQVVRAG